MAVIFWNIPFQFTGTVFVIQFQDISYGHELVFWEYLTLKLCTELRWENVCDCQLGIWSKLHTSLQINKTALCHCNLISMLSWYTFSTSFRQWPAKWVWQYQKTALLHPPIFLFFQLLNLLINDWLQYYSPIFRDVSVLVVTFVMIWHFRSHSVPIKVH